MQQPPVVSEALRERVSAALAAEGWMPARFGGVDALTYVLPLGGGFTATGQVRALSSGVTLLGPGMGRPGPPRGWGGSEGAGFQPALDLGPRLTLRPHHALVTQGSSTYPTDAESDVLIPPGLPDDELVPAVVRTIRGAREFGLGLASASAMETRLRARGWAGPDQLDPELLVFLCALGRAPEAASEASRLLALTPPADRAHEDVRFARQLDRWVQAGCPAPPPLDAWPADLYSGPEPPSPRSRERRKAEDKTDKDLYAAVRARTRGRSREEVLAVVLEERAERGLSTDPVMATVAADLLIQQRQPFGGLRSGARMVSMFGRLAWGTFHDVLGEDGTRRWPDPPADALFPVPGSEDFTIPTDILPGARGWLRETLGHDAGQQLVLHRGEAWLDRSSDAGATVVSVHLGDREVGRLAPADAALFDPAFEAAGSFGEKPLVTVTFKAYAEALSLTLDRPRAFGRLPEF